MFLPQSGSKTVALIILIAGLSLVLVVVFARFLPGTFTSLNRAFFRNHALGEKKKGLNDMGRAATKTMRTRTRAGRPPAVQTPPGETPVGETPRGPIIPEPAP